MHHAPQTVVLLINDQMFREGLKLLLEDMHFDVISAESFFEYDKFEHTQTPPSLLVISLVFNNQAAIELVGQLRDKFNARIPAILLSEENGTNLSPGDENDIRVLPEQIKPQDLRRAITAFLKHT